MDSSEFKRVGSKYRSRVEVELSSYVGLVLVFDMLHDQSTACLRADNA